MDSNVILILVRMLAVIGIAIFGVWLLVKLLMVLGVVAGATGRGIGRGGRHIGQFIKGEASDIVHIAGGIITSLVFVPMVLGSVVLGRWSKANHYGRALEREAVGVGTAAWRVALGHPARLFGLDNLIEGVERRIPDAMARAPGPDAPTRKDRFEGYVITGSLPSGGSGARLFLAQAEPEKREQLAAAGMTVPDHLVIKSFSLNDGSSMPQIVRESRALEAARKLGLVLEHELAGTRFHYVMPYVPGDDLHVVTQKLHQESGAGGLAPEQMKKVIGYTADLLTMLHRFHTSGLWHKDVKPTNIIVSDERVQLVDLGLTTPLTSAMTLTTHGTEYFRDPELVRLALRGVKVHEVDGVKFDIYGAGAVMYSMIENGFPAHGSLSQITQRCPEALRWIVRRAMTDMSQRYSSTTEMLADVRKLMEARDPYDVKPAQLPSMAGKPRAVERLEQELEKAAAAASASFGPPAEAKTQPSLKRRKGFLRRRPRPDTQRPAAMAMPAGPATARSGRIGLGTIVSVFIGFLVAGVLALGAFVTLGARSDMSAVPPAPELSAYARADAPRRVSPVPAAPQLDWTSRRPEPTVVLLLDDVPSVASEDTRSLIDTRLGDLEQARFVLVGGNRESDLDEERQIELRAEARRVLELDDPRDSDAQERLSAFIAQHGDELGGLLWLGRDDADPDVIDYQYIPSRLEDRQDVQLILEPGSPVAGHDRSRGGSTMKYSIH